MTLDSAWLYAYFLIFCRASAMLLASPLFAQTTPLQVRLFFAGILALSSQGVVHSPGPLADNLGTLLAAVGTNLVIGLLIGLIIQWFLLGLQMAGAFLDTQLGLNTLQMLNPAVGTSTTVMANFKFMLSLVIFLLMDGHHQMLLAFWASFEAPVVFDAPTIGGMMNLMVPYMGKLCLLALQVAAPAAATTMVIDAAASLINKSIPQMQVYFLTAGLKTVSGVAAISLSLPLIVVAVRHGVEHVTMTTLQLFTVGR